MNLYTTDAQILLSEIFEGLAEALDITEDQHNKIVKSYGAVGEWLAASDSILAPYKPEIFQDH